MAEKKIYIVMGIDTSTKNQTTFTISTQSRVGFPHVKTSHKKIQIARIKKAQNLAITHLIGHNVGHIASKSTYNPNLHMRLGFTCTATRSQL